MPFRNYFCPNFGNESGWLFLNTVIIIFAQEIYHVGVQEGHLIIDTIIKNTTWSLTIIMQCFA